MKAIMNCKQCAELLVDYSCAALPPASREAVAGHLQNCRTCSVELAGLQQIEALLDRTEEPSARLQQNFQVRLAAEIGHHVSTSIPKVQPRAGLFQAWWPSRPVAAICYSFALLACGVVSGQLLPPSSLGIGGEYVLQGNNRDSVAQLCSVPGRTNNDVL